MGQTFKVGDRVIRPGSRYFARDHYYIVQKDGLDRLYVHDDENDLWYPITDGGFELVAPEAQSADPTKDAVLAFIKDHYLLWDVGAQLAHDEMVRRLFGLDIQEVPATVEFIPV